MNKVRKVRLEIVIEVDENKTDLFACGAKDLRNYFIPEWTGCKTSDITKCQLYIVGESGLYIGRHKDNYVGKFDGLYGFIKAEREKQWYPTK